MSRCISLIGAMITWIVSKKLRFELFRIHLSSSEKCYLNMKRLKNIPSSDDCVMVCISVTVLQI